jgi:hypothetical protein
LESCIATVEKQKEKRVNITFGFAAASKRAYDHEARAIVDGFIEDHKHGGVALESKHKRGESR